MTISFKPFRMPSGLILYARESPDSEDFLSLRVPRESLGFLAMECLKELGPDAPEDLIEECRALIKAADKTETSEAVPWRMLKEEVQIELHGIVIEEIRDSLKEYAIDELDGYSLETCAELMLVGEMDRDPTPEEIKNWIEQNKAE